MERAASPGGSDSRLARLERSTAGQGKATQATPQARPAQSQAGWTASPAGADRKEEGQTGQSDLRIPAPIIDIISPCRIHALLKCLDFHRCFVLEPLTLPDILLTRSLEARCPVFACSMSTLISL